MLPIVQSRKEKLIAKIVEETQVRGKQEVRGQLCASGAPKPGREALTQAKQRAVQKVPLQGAQSLGSCRGSLSPTGACASYPDSPRKGLGAP